MKIHWLSDLEEHDIAAAETYLSLVLYPEDVSAVVTEFEDFTIQTREFKARDILRASGLTFMHKGDIRVHTDCDRISKGVELSPILLVLAHDRLHIADGYYRLCAVYSIDEDAEIPCKIVYL